MFGDVDSRYQESVDTFNRFEHGEGATASKFDIGEQVIINFRGHKKLPGTIIDKSANGSYSVSYTFGSYGYHYSTTGIFTENQLRKSPFMTIEEALKRDGITEEK